MHCMVYALFPYGSIELYMLGMANLCSFAIGFLLASGPTQIITYVIIHEVAFVLCNIPTYFVFITGIIVTIISSLVTMMIFCIIAFVGYFRKSKTEGKVAKTVDTCVRIINLCSYRTETSIIALTIN